MDRLFSRWFSFRKSLYAWLALFVSQCERMKTTFIEFIESKIEKSEHYIGGDEVEGEVLWVLFGSYCECFYWEHKSATHKVQNDKFLTSLKTSLSAISAGEEDLMDEKRPFEYS